MTKVLLVILFMVIVFSSTYVKPTPITTIVVEPPKPIVIEPPKPIEPITIEPKIQMYPPEALFGSPPSYASMNLDIPTSMSYNEPISYKITEPFMTRSIFTDLGDVALLPPEIALDLIVGTFDALFGVDQPDSVTAGLLDFHVGPMRAHLFSVFIENLLKREMRYFAGFGDSYLNTPSFMDGTTAIEESNLMSDQRKILWDVGKNTYLSKYRIKIDGIKDEAFYFSDWRGIDFVMLPALVTGYLYYRGLEKKVSFLDTEGKIYLEPLQRWIGRDNLMVGVGVEWGPKDWPVKLLVAAGIDEGDVNVQFIGIGTSIGMVKKLLFIQSGEKE